MCRHAFPVRAGEKGGKSMEGRRKALPRHQIDQAGENRTAAHENSHRPRGFEGRQIQILYDAETSGMGPEHARGERKGSENRHTAAICQGLHETGPSAEEGRRLWRRYDSRRQCVAVGTVESPMEP